MDVVNEATRPALADYLETLRARTGRRTRSVVHDVEKGAIAKFARAIGATSPVHFDEAYARTTRFGGIVAPPTYASWFLTGLVPDEVFDLTGTPFDRYLHSDDVVRSRRPIRAGDRITAWAEYAACDVKQGRNGPLLFQRADLTLEDATGAVVAVVGVSSVSF